MPCGKTPVLLSLSAAILCFAASSSCLAANADAGLQSSLEMDFDAIAAIDGIRVVAAEDIPEDMRKSYTEDYGPVQVLEIIRPDRGPISVGRLMTSCSCLRAAMPKRDFAQAERAFIEVRNVKPTQPAGATYLVFARISSPYAATLQYELYAKSDRAPTASAASATPAR